MFERISGPIAFLALIGLGVVGGCADPTQAEAQTDTDPRGSSSGTSGASGTPEGGTSAGPEGMQDAACAEYLACIEGLDPASATAAARRYGPDGSCWGGTGDEALSCAQECSDGIDRLCDASRDSTAGTTGPDGPPPCAVSTLAPQAQSWLVAGEGPGELPVAVGAVIERNCGCHLAELDAFDDNVPLYYGTLRLSTWDDFQANYRGAPVHAEVKVRAIDTLSMPPIYFCGDQAHGSLTEEDYALLAAWLDEGAPDAPTWSEIASGGGGGG